MCNERRKFNVLLWKENSFIRPQRFKNRMLTLEEANERLHRYFPNMDVLIYRSVVRPALVHCKDCNKTFETKHALSSYIYGSKLICEECKKLNYINECLDLVKDTKFEFKGIRIRKDYRGCDRKVLLLYCNDCGREVEFNPDEDIRDYNCPGCKYRNILNKRNELLKDINMYVTDYRYDEDGAMWFNCVCVNCGEIKERRADKLNKIKGCPSCKDIATRQKAIDTYQRCGFKFTNQIKYRNNVGQYDTIRRKEVCIHLFCGNEAIKYSYVLRYNSLCKACQRRIVSGKPKEHNKHLVQEKLQMLKNVRNFRDAWVKQIPNALETLEEGFAKTVLEHLDGWIANYEAIIENYPNGDLGTVIENSPLYEQVENVFYPVMEKYGFKR